MTIRIEDIIAFAGLENRNNNQQLGELIGCLEHQLFDVDYDLDFIKKIVVIIFQVDSLVRSM